MDEKFIDIKKACEILNTSSTTIRRWIRVDGLPCFKIGGYYKFLESELKQYIKDKRVN